MSEWIEHNGGVCSVRDDDLVKVKYRDVADRSKGIRIEWPVRADCLEWYHDGQDDDIVAYRVIEP